MRLLALLLLVLATAPALSAQSGSDSDADRLARLLTEFLEGAAAGDVATHDRFWDDDLVYTSSSGSRFGKAELMAGLSAPDASDSNRTSYSAEQVVIRLYGPMAVVTFRLVAATETPDGIAYQRFWNSGTFRKRGGVWRVVNWQATRIPE